MAAQIGILNVGAGDTKLVFDKSNPAECIRSGRIVTDMLRRGYALLIEVDDGKGGKVTTRVREFREDVGEYIIADFDPITAAKADETEHAQGEQGGQGPASAEGGPEDGQQSGEPASKVVIAPRRKSLLATRSIPATAANGVAVARSAGG